MLHPTGNARERILLIGPWGGGKSFAWSKIVDWMVQTNAPGTVNIIDTDRAVDRYIDASPDWDERVRSWDAYRWPEYVAALTEALTTASRDDWLIVDHISNAWGAVQDFYIQEVFGTNAASFFLNAKKEGKKGSPLADAHATNWQVINKQYNEWIGPLLRWPGHILACAPADPVVQPGRDGAGGDSKAILDTYGRFGVKPGGQKMLGFQFLSVLLMQPMGLEKWVMSSLKELKRDRPQGKEVQDFVVDYLVQVAGWMP